jgi:hypothetical protein
LVAAIEIYLKYAEEMKKDAELKKYVYHIRTGTPFNKIRHTGFQCGSLTHVLYSKRSGHM